MLLPHVILALFPGPLMDHHLLELLIFLLLSGLLVWSVPDRPVVRCGHWDVRGLAGAGQGSRLSMALRVDGQVRT